MMNKVLLYTTIILIIISCASTRIPTKVLSQPEWIAPVKNANQRKITIASINHFNSSLAPQTEFYEGVGEIKVGGLSLLKKYSSILKEKFNNEVLFLNTGELINQNQKGGIGTILHDLQNLGIDAFHLSEKELRKLTPSQIDRYRNTFLNSNIISLKNQTLLSSKNIDNYLIKTINGIKVGVIAVTTFKNIEARAHKFLNGLYFADPIFSILKTHDQLERKGVKVFVLMIKTHEACSDKECISQTEEVEQLLTRLPPNKIDLIVGSEPIHLNHKVYGIPFIQNTGSGKYLSRAELTYDTLKKKVITKKTKIYSPIKLCSNFFKATSDCHIENDYHQDAKTQLIKDSGKLKTKAKFLGVEI